MRTEARGSHHLPLRTSAPRPRHSPSSPTLHVRRSECRRDPSREVPGSHRAGATRRKKGALWRRKTPGGGSDQILDEPFQIFHPRGSWATHRKTSAGSFCPVRGADPPRVWMDKERSTASGCGLPAVRNLLEPRLRVEPFLPGGRARAIGPDQSNAVSAGAIVPAPRRLMGRPPACSRCIIQDNERSPLAPRHRQEFFDKGTSPILGGRQALSGIRVGGNTRCKLAPFGRAIQRIDVGCGTPRSVPFRRPGRA